MEIVYRILLLEDDRSHIELISETISRIDLPIHLDVTSDKNSFLKFLDSNDYDLIISDYRLPNFSGLEALSVTRELNHDLPFIIVSAYLDTETAINTMLMGASDYVLKDNLNRLGPAVKREIINYRQKSINDQRLSESKTKYETLVNSIDGIVWEADANSLTHMYISPQSERILGFIVEDILTTYIFWPDIVHPDDREEILMTHRENIEKGTNHILEYRLITKNKELIWIRDFITVNSYDGHVTTINGLKQDITRFKLFTKLESLEKNVLTKNTEYGLSLDEILEYYINSIEHIQPGLIPSLLTVKDGRVFTWVASDRLSKSFLDAINNQPIGPNAGSCGTSAFLKETVIVSDINTDPRWKAYKEIALSENLHACWSQPLFDKSGQVFATFALYYEEKRSPTIFEEYLIERTRQILQIIIENKQNHHWLSLFSSVIAKSTEAIAIFETSQENKHGRKLIYINEAFSDLTGYEPEDVIGHSLTVLSGPNTDQEEATRVQNSMKNMEPCEAELINYKKNGDEFWNYLSVAPVQASDGGADHWICIGRDVTERKRKEQELRESIQEKEMLLMEVHHRVKNNLAVVSGMMQLQAYSDNDPVLQSKLYDSVSRIQTMASIHELLYESHSFSKLELDKNISKLVKTLIKSFKSQTSIDLNLNLQAITLNINQTIPLSLIINEVVTNVLKHAFQPSDNGILDITLTGDQTYIDLKITDNGIGLPESFGQIQENGSLGLTLIKTLVTQLKADFRFERLKKGTAFHLRFKWVDKKGSGSNYLS